MMKIPIAEIFGPTISGEGPTAGLPCCFIRMGGCDSKCTWCDSPHAVLAQSVRHLPRYSVYEIRQQVAEFDPHPNWMVISGGNPVLHDLTELVGMLRDEGWSIQAETQGTRWRFWLTTVDLLVVSPKPPSSGMTDTEASLAKFFANFDAYRLPRTALKVVVFTKEDYIYAQNVHRKYPGIPFYLSCGTVPEESVDTENTRTTLGPADDARSLGKRYGWLCDLAAADPVFRDVRCGVQLHVVAWGHERRR